MLDAHVVPLGQAAERIVQAYRLAAPLVLAATCLVGGVAVAGPVQTSREGAAAKLRRFSHAVLVPIHVAAVLVNSADGVAAFYVFARG